ncbi:histidine kinase [Actinoplanes sp. NBC_00393]|uniref:histidine kinase n=1 Tax=Actinoplanes sp. NBC_00393 TaxID=2975953 RepID=UPI002E1C5ED7
MSDRYAQVLAAVLVKAELAVRLIERNPAAARRELEGLLAVVRAVLRELRAVAPAARPVSLRRELDRAATLLEAAGIGTQIRLAEGSIPRRAEELLVRAVREATVDLLCRASTPVCRLSIEPSADLNWTLLVNDVPVRPG